eukprot:3344272-Rhodomonas_salina.1
MQRLLPARDDKGRKGEHRLEQREGQRERRRERELGNERVGEALRAEPELPTGNLDLELVLDSGHVTRILSHVIPLSHVI